MTILPSWFLPLPERGGRKFVGCHNNNDRNNQGGGRDGGGGLGYFHPHAKFQVYAAVHDSVVEKTTTTVSSPTIFSASVTVGNNNKCGSVEVFTSMMTKNERDHHHQPYTTTTTTIMTMTMNMINILLQVIMTNNIPNNNMRLRFSLLVSTHNHRIRQI